MKLQKSLQLQDICQYRQKTLLFRSVCNNDLNCSGFMKKISKWNINGKKKALWVGFSSSVIECFLSKTSVNLQMDLFDNLYIYIYIHTYLWNHTPFVCQLPILVKRPCFTTFHNFVGQVNMATAPSGWRPCDSCNGCNEGDPGPTSSATTPLGHQLSEAWNGYDGLGEDGWPNAPCNNVPCLTMAH